MKAAAVFAACMVLALSSAPTRSATVFLTPTADTSIFSNAPLRTNNVGGSQSLASGDTANRGPVRMLLRFDLQGQLPPGATVTSAGLGLTVTMVPGAAQNSTFGLHRLLVDWGEGTGGVGQLIGTGRLALNGEATWLARFHPSSLWGLAGGQGEVDYAGTASSTAMAGLGIGKPAFPSTAALVADVQRWLDDPASNFGWIAISQSESTPRTARRFGSKEHPNLQSRPTLQVEFERLVAENIRLEGGEIHFDFEGQQGGSYQVQRGDDLQSGDWLGFSQIGPLLAGGPVQVAVPATGAMGFYRLKKLPVILLQPQPQTVTLGSDAMFQISVVGGDNLTYQWQFNGMNIPDATNNILTVVNVQEDDLGNYQVIVTDGPDSLTSATASLQLRVAPVIVEQPSNQTNVVGSTVSFSVTVTNTATLPIYYQWRKGAQRFELQVVNERMNTLTLTNIQLADAGQYRVAVSNAVSFTPGFLSSAASLVVQP